MTKLNLNTAGKLSCLLGALALACFAVTPQPKAEQVAQESGPPDAGEERLRNLDPWNVQLRDRPQWDPRNAPPQLQNRAKRHLEFLQGGVPVEYRSQRSPYPNVPNAITAGGEVYRSNCIACHGAKGRGDGDAGLDLLPSPALLSEMMDKQGTVDEYLLWTISEGGQAFGTAMPAYKDRLTENQIWQVIAYLRAGFPPPN